MYKHSDYRKSGTYSNMHISTRKSQSAFLPLIIAVILLVIISAFVFSVSPAGAQGIKAVEFWQEIPGCWSDPIVGPVPVWMPDDNCHATYKQAESVEQDSTDTVQAQVDTVSIIAVPAPVNDVPDTETESPVENTPAPAPVQSGNPGNDKPVGNAGEHCNQGMCENGDGTGEHGRSDND